MELPKRKSIRLKDYDYSQNGAYFVTICTHNKECIFGEICGEKVELNTYGLIVLNHIKILSGLYDDIKIDKYVIMPNHIHMIIVICRECIVCIPPTKDKSKMLIPKIIQTFKSSITKEIRMLKNLHRHDDNAGTENLHRHAYNACPTTIWQARYYDHIIRNEKECLKILEYIDTNPQKWEQDKLYNAPRTTH